MTKETQTTHHSSSEITSCSDWLFLWPVTGWLVGAWPCFKLGSIGLPVWIIDAPISGPFTLFWWMS